MLSTSGTSGWRLWLWCVLGDQRISTHDLLLEVDPLGDGEVELRLREVDEHAGDLGSFAISDQLLDVLVDGVTDLLLLALLLGVLELRRDEHHLDLILVALGVHDVNHLRLGSRQVGALGDHALVQHLRRRSHLSRVWLLRRDDHAIVAGSHGVSPHVASLVTTSGSLEVRPLVHVVTSSLHTHLVRHRPATHVVAHEVVHGARTVLGPIVLVELECGLQK